MQPQNLLLDTNAIRLAELELDGLALCWFNRAAKWWEVAFLREVSAASKNPHIFSICIEKKDQNNQTVGDPYNVPPEHLRNVRRLNLQVGNGSNAHYTQFPKGYFGYESFDRAVGAHPLDFGWVIDFGGSELNEHHGGFTGLKIPRAFYATVLKVPHALFYTKEVTKDPMLLLERGKTDKSEGEVFGYTNELVGAHMLAETPGDVRLIGTDIQRHVLIDETLAYQEGHYYRLVFKCMEMRRRKIVSEIVKSGERKKKAKIKDYKEGDFDAFYEVIELEKGNRYNLWGPDRTVTKGKLGDCNIVRIDPDEGVETLEYLLGQEP
jgi:hypothetical protein